MQWNHSGVLDLIPKYLNIIITDKDVSTRECIMKRYRESRIYRLYNSKCTMKEKRIYERVCLMNFLSRSKEKGQKDDESVRLVTKVSMIVSALRRI